MIIARELMNHDEATIVRELLEIGFDIQEIANFTQIPFSMVRETIKNNNLTKRRDLSYDSTKRAQQVMREAIALRRITKQATTKKAIDRYLCIDGPGKKIVQQLGRALQELCNPPMTDNTKAEIDFLIVLLDTPRQMINPIHEARKLFDLIRVDQRMLKTGDPLTEIREFLVEQYRQQVVPYLDENTVHTVVNDLLTPEAGFALTVDQTALLRAHYGIGFKKKTLPEIAVDLQMLPKEVKNIYNQAMANARKKCHAKKLQLLFYTTGALVSRIKYLEEQLKLYADSCDMSKPVLTEPLPDRIAKITFSDPSLFKEGLALPDAMIEKLKLAGITTVGDLCMVDVRTDPRLMVVPGLGLKTKVRLIAIQEWAQEEARLKYSTE